MIRVASSGGSCNGVSIGGYSIVKVGICILGSIIADLSSIATIAIG